MPISAGLKLNPLLVDFIGGTIGMLAGIWEKEICDRFKGPIETANNLYNAYSKFIPQNQLNTNIEIHAISIISNIFVTQYFSLKFAERSNKFSNDVENINQAKASVWNGFSKQTFYFAVFVIPVAISSVSSSFIDYFFNKELQDTLQDNISLELYSGKSALRLSQHENATVLKDNLEDDVSAVTRGGGSLISGAISSYIKGASGCVMLFIGSRDIFTYSIMYNMATAYVAGKFAFKGTEYSKLVRSLKSELASVKRQNITKDTSNRVHDLDVRLRETDRSQSLLQMVNNLWITIDPCISYTTHCGFYLTNNFI